MITDADRARICEAMGNGWRYSYVMHLGHVYETRSPVGQIIKNEAEFVLAVHAWLAAAAIVRTVTDRFPQTVSGSLPRVTVMVSPDFKPSRLIGDTGIGVNAFRDAILLAALAVLDAKKGSAHADSGCPVHSEPGQSHTRATCTCLSGTPGAAP